MSGPGANGAANPAGVPARATADFLASGLAPGSTILEVGCGDGAVARELMRRGYRVTAVDGDREAVALARARGVAVVEGWWPDVDLPPVAMVAFTRSLHHIGPLAAAVARAGQLLRRGGTLRVEDFAFDEADEATMAWFLGVLESRAARALVAEVPGEFVTDLLAAGDPLGLWHESHEHDLQTMTAMSCAIGESFDIGESAQVPYLYRYLVPVLPATAEGAAFMEDVLREESRMGEQGEIVLLGRRLTATPRPAAEDARDRTPGRRVPPTEAAG